MPLPDQFEPELDRIRVSHVVVRPKYYIKCDLCGSELGADNMEEIVRMANSYGWRYDFANDLILCPECIDKVVKEV